MGIDIARAIVVGAAGRMGMRILAAIHETPNVLLAAAVERSDHPSLGRDAGEIAGLEKWNIPLSGILKEVIASGDVSLILPVPSLLWAT
jgi:4-hydroxy-tetrahydrodipicolinate reductase